MSTAVVEYEKLVADQSIISGVAAGQMFGKACLKINGKAFIAQHKEFIVFKLTGSHHENAMSATGAQLWDPSGKGRPMKEWVALPITENKNFKTFAAAALSYVASS